MKRDAREIMERIAWVISAVLLVADAHRDNDAVSVEVARRWLAKTRHTNDPSDWADAAAWDRRIVFEAGEAMGEPSSKL